MAMIDDKIARAQVIDPGGRSRQGAFRRDGRALSDIETEEEVTYTIVGEDEADAKQGLHLVTSPVARAIMGKEVGDDVTREGAQGRPRVRSARNSPSRNLIPAIANRRVAAANELHSAGSRALHVGGPKLRRPSHPFPGSSAGRAGGC